ncbi:MAG: cytochrome c-type biogenesis protein CcmH [Anaerolineales bacterium]|jgi:cytochrome c-type biogenesis protein CcmH
MKLKSSWLLLLVVFVVLLVISPAMAEEPAPTPSDDEVNAIAKKMYCPVCENVPLDVCGTQACAQWREEIRDKLTQGWSEQEIYDYFVLKYGERVLAEPPRRGLNWLVYIAPPLAVIIGVVFLYRGYRNWRKPVEELASEAPPPSGEVQDEYLSKMEEELKKRE